MWIFQSTGPLRGPTSAKSGAEICLIFQSTGPLRGPTCYFSYFCLFMCISIHRPLAGPDRNDGFIGGGRIHFNPQAPCGARHQQQSSSRQTYHFNPQAPCGARLITASDLMRSPVFQSTGPLRGPTKMIISFTQRKTISIHRPLAGPDVRQRPFPGYQSEFQSTGPLRGPTDYGFWVRRIQVFQSTGPLRGPTL